MINSMGDTGAIFILLAGAIILEHIVAWAGSILHSVPSTGESNYAVLHSGMIRISRCPPIF